RCMHQHGRCERVSMKFGCNGTATTLENGWANGGYMGGLRNVKRLLVVVVVAVFSVCGLYAQTFGEVSGHVTDASGALIPGASLTLTNVNTNATRNVLTTESGAYTFPSVPPGPYRLKTELPGFKTVLSERFELQVQQALRLDVVLQVGQVS